MFIVDKNDGMTNVTNVETCTDGLRISNVGLHRTNAGHTFGPAVREYYLIHFIMRGRGRFFAEDKTYDLHEGQCFLIRPRQVTTYCADSHEPWQYCWMGFSGGEAESLVNAVFAASPIGGFDAFILSELIQSMENVQDFALFDLKLRHYLHALLLSAYRPGRILKTDNDVILSARRYIAANYDRAFDIAGLAGELGYSRAHFTTMFTRAVGMPPHMYLTRYRLECARSLITEKPELTVTEVALSVGYNSIERFSAAFKKHFGMPPSCAKRQETVPAATMPRV